ncbi:MAG TPA: ferritin-like domain-containing protein [Polyangiaceae bacterium]|nr:ferritin-like domain-containing protein [Polyangiaceae bacterium]
MAANAALHSDPSDSVAIERLTAFCREELGATRAYEKALALSALRPYAEVLRRCHASHRRCAVELGDRLAALGVRAPSAPGMWGSLVPMLSLTSNAMTARQAIILLDESEGRALQHYREEASRLDPINRGFMLERILPAQNAAHVALGLLRVETQPR